MPDEVEDSRPHRRRKSEARVSLLDLAGAGEAIHQPEDCRAHRGSDSEHVPASVTSKKNIFRRRDHWPIDRFSEIVRSWDGATVVCIAGGPSLTREQAERAQASCPVIVANDAYLLAPKAQALYFADSKWWKWHKDRDEFKSFAGEKCTIENTGRTVEDPEVHIIRNLGREGLSSDPTGVMTGYGSGYMAINIAVLAGAKRILLLGFDNKPMNGKNHFFGEHPDKSRQPFVLWNKAYRSLITPLKELGVEVINCSPGTAIEAFPKMSLEAAL